MSTKFLCVQRFSTVGPLRSALCVTYHGGLYKDVRAADCSGPWFPTPLYPTNTHTHTHPRTHTHVREGDNGITYSPRQLIFQNTKTRIRPSRQLALLPLHRELHKFYSKWRTTSGCSTRTGETRMRTTAERKDQGAE
jgi:hypothetical protein